jgi:hypothetical protein
VALPLRIQIVLGDFSKNVLHMVNVHVIYKSLLTKNMVAAKQFSYRPTVTKFNNRISHIVFTVFILNQKVTKS